MSTAIRNGAAGEQPEGGRGGGRGGSRMAVERSGGEADGYEDGRGDRIRVGDIKERKGWEWT